MGIDLHSLNFLRFCHKVHGDFGETVTLARHGLHLTQALADDTFNREVVTEAQQRREYFIDETLKRRFGSTSVESTDFSDYQGASIIHDLNIPLPKVFRQFDMVLDAGTTEHVFSVTNALANARALCRPGGLILHILPANNFCGHGFWQFSPELFWSLYSKKNGFHDTEIYLAKLNDTKRWYRLDALAHGGRANIFSNYRVNLLVKTVKNKNEPEVFEAPQQISYIDLWTSGKNNKDDPAQQRQDQFLVRLRRWIDRNPTLRGWRNSFFRNRPPFSMRLNSFNPCLEPVQVKKTLEAMAPVIKSDF